ncbi:MAG: elongation factor G [Prochlorotrichaceae cyanobacterium]
MPENVVNSTPTATSGIRNVAIVGPYSSGKTTLLESLLFVAGATSRKGQVQEGNTVGDSAPEARDRQMTVEVSAAQLEYNGLRFNFIDCPGSVEFSAETWSALMGVDAAIVVCEPDLSRVLTLSPIFRFLDDWNIPHLVWINKMDRARETSFLDVLHTLKAVSSRPLVPHQYPIRQGDAIVGFIDLVTEQAYHYHAGAAADPVPFPAELAEEEQAARAELLESLADFDDHLLEELLEEVEPSQTEIEQDLKWELGADLIVPTFMGIATEDFGVRPLLDALVREAPDPSKMAERRLPEVAADTLVAQVLKTYVLPQAGKLSLLRIWQGQLTEGVILNGSRSGGLYHLMGSQTLPIQVAEAGDIVAVSRLEGINTGDTVMAVAKADEVTIEVPRVDLPLPVYALAIAPERRNDEVKLSSALNKLLEEDPSLKWEQHGDTQEVILWGQGEIHLLVSLDRLRRKYNLPMNTQMPQVPYRETIRKSKTNIHGRYKHQTGGHGQFGDVYLDIQPLDRGSGFNFKETIVGGVVPRQYIPGVEAGVREFLKQGPLGYPVVDVSVTLTNGSYHSVDSSEQAFRQAARIAMQSGLQACDPVLLEPILSVEISVPTEFTSNVLRLISGRRGQILGYDVKENWNSWDIVSAYLPQAEMQDLIIELRSLTQGVGFFKSSYAHLQEVVGREADRLIKQD